MPKPLLTVAVAGCLVLLAGCGNSRTPVPNIDRPAPPAGFRKLTVGSAGISLVTRVTGRSPTRRRRSC